MKISRCNGGRSGGAKHYGAYKTIAKSGVFLAVIAPMTHAFTLDDIYNDRAAWESNVGAPLNFQEDFERYNTVDENDRLYINPLSVGPFTLSVASGQPQSENHLVQLSDPSPISSGIDSTWTTFIRAFVDATEDPGLPPTSPVTVLIEFTIPIVAWGADYSGAFGNEGVTLEFTTLTGRKLTDTVDLPNNDGFIGIVFDPVTDGPISAITLRGQTLGDDGVVGIGEVFALDNVAGRLGAPSASLPEPATLALLSLGLAGLGFSRAARGARTPSSSTATAG